MRVPPEYWDWGHWIKSLATRDPFVIGGDDDPYLLRWYLIPRNPYLNVYLHKFLRSDDDRALHDHPWWFLSLLLKGGYIEHREDGTVRRKRGSVAVRRADVLHRVELLHGYKSLWDAASGVAPAELPAWTLFFTGPKIREWGFKCPKGWLHWKEFDKRNGCGEFA